jgi:hypothetical protein
MQLEGSGGVRVGVCISPGLRLPPQREVASTYREDKIERTPQRQDLRWVLWTWPWPPSSDWNFVFYRNLCS